MGLKLREPPRENLDKKPKVHPEKKVLLPKNGVLIRINVATRNGR